MAGGTSRSGLRCPFLLVASANGCRETIKRLLAFPPDTNIIWKSHDDSIAQRTAIDQARQEKAAAHAHQHQHLGGDRRRVTANDDSVGDKGKGAAAS